MNCDRPGRLVIMAWMKGRDALGPASCYFRFVHFFDCFIFPLNKSMDDRCGDESEVYTIYFLND